MEPIAHTHLSNMKQVLQYQTSTRFFKEFSTRTYCNENILFFLDAENYQSLPGTDYMIRTAVKIVRKYIQEKAQLQINISSKTREEILKKVLGEASRTIFKKAQDEIFRLMETDALPKFISSPEYEKMMQCVGVGAPRPGTLNGVQPFD